MLARPRRVFLFLLVASAGLAPVCFGQQPTTVSKVTQVMGMEGIKKHTKGTLTVDKGVLRFEANKTTASVPARSIEDVVTGNDSERMLHGFVGTLTMFGPYGSGRFMSLFRTKLDTLTVNYRDADGGLHGAIYMLGAGQAEAVKKALLAEGARTTIPLEEEKKDDTQKPKEEKP